MNEARPRSARISTLVHATENLEKVVQAMRAICPQDFSGNLKTFRVRGHYGNEITICRLMVDGRHRAEPFVDYVWKMLGASDRKMLYTGLDEYLDSAGTLHLRVNKQKASEGQVILGSTDPVKVEVSFRFLGTDGQFAELVRKRISKQVEPAKPTLSVGSEGSSQ